MSKAKMLILGAAVIVQEVELPGIFAAGQSDTATIQSRRGEAGCVLVETGSAADRGGRASS